MKIKIILFFLISIFLTVSCSKDENKISTITEKSQELQVLEAYQEGMKSLEGGDVLYQLKI